MISVQGRKFLLSGTLHLDKGTARKSQADRLLIIGVLYELNSIYSTLFSYTTHSPYPCTSPISTEQQFSSQNGNITPTV